MKRRAGWVLLVGLSLLSGCMAGKEARSAGSVGCAPDEIEISDEQHHGVLVQSADTWLASCRGRTFVCTQVNQSSEDREGGWTNVFASNISSDQVSCQEEAESPQEEENREARRLARLKQALVPQPAPSAAPTGAAGFEFGSSLDEAQRRCEAAGNTWSTPQPDIGSCSGTAVQLGIPATVSLRFCAERACSIAIEHRPRAGWSREVVTLKAKLEGKYGAADAETRGIPSKCRSEADFTHCLDSRELKLEYSWRWGTGETVSMTVGKASPNASSAIRLVYTGSSSRVDASAL
jgi:hypothetical protein